VAAPYCGRDRGNGAWFPARHLISQNIANGSAKVERPHAAVSILNFHYAYPPDAVGQNYGLNRVIGDNETGFRGTNNLPYRVEAWNFILAGGGLYNNLDYSFAVGHEQGNFVYPSTQPGGGNPAFRREMRVLRDFMREVDFLKMKPLIDAPAPGDSVLRSRVLAEPGRTYAVYVGPDLNRKEPESDKAAGSAVKPRQMVISLEVAEGEYTVKWISPVTGRTEKQERVRHRGGALSLGSPEFETDIAAVVKRVGK
jgi:hypothetical protein